MKKLFILSLLSLCLLPLSSCNDKPKNPYANIDRSHLNGIDEPLVYDIQVQGFDAEIAIDLASILGAKSFRLRLPDNCATSTGTFNATVKENVDSVLAMMKEKDIEPIGQCMVFPSNTSFVKQDAHTVPRQNDPHYKEYLEAVSAQWKTIAKIFPDVKIWEMGNESNSNIFFHPNGYYGSFGSASTDGGFTFLESADVLTDYMFYAAKGIKEGNPNARSLMPGLTSYNSKSMSNIIGYVEEIYSNINSGDYPTCSDTKSKKVDDYFNILGWHPYVEKVDEYWLEGQKNIYQVVIDAGDEGRPVIYTEFGFTDLDNAELEEKQFGYYKLAYEYVQNDMPFVERMCAFRLFNCKYAAAWGGLGETTFGFFVEPTGGHGFAPKQKAYSLQELYGGEGDLTKYY